MFESILRDALVHHLERKCLINDSQHGFRKGRSCLTNQLTFLEKVTGYTDSGSNVDTVFLDFAKAFDKVPHYRLAMKLTSHGIGGKVHDWLVEWTVPEFVYTVHYQAGWQFSVECHKTQSLDLFCS